MKDEGTEEGGGGDALYRLFGAAFSLRKRLFFTAEALRRGEGKGKVKTGERRGG